MRFKIEFNDNGRFRITEEIASIKSDWSCDELTSITIEGKRYYYATEYWLGFFPINTFFTINELASTKKSYNHNI